MAKEFTNNFYVKREWLSCRDSYISTRINIDGGMCERCHNNLGHIVHHKIELTPENIQDPDIALCHKNLEYVCLYCHNKEHNVFQGADRKVLFDDDGNVIEVVDREKIF